MRKKLALLLTLLMLCSPVSTGIVYADMAEELIVEIPEVAPNSQGDPKETPSEPLQGVENQEDPVSEMPDDDSEGPSEIPVESPDEDSGEIPSEDQVMDAGEELAVESEDPLADAPAEIPESVLKEVVAPEITSGSVEVELEDIDLDDPLLGEKYFVVQYSDGTIKTMKVQEPESRGIQAMGEELVDIDSQIELYAHQSDVEIVEPLLVRRTADIKAAYTPNDPYYLDDSQWGVKAIKADRLYGWDYTNDVSDVVIAILDTGMDMDHPDLAGNLASVEHEGVMVNGYDIFNNDTDPSDKDGHGTHVAGVAAALVNNGIGVAGVAGEVKILPIKVMDDAGYGSQTKVAQGIDWAVSHGADIINMSLVGPGKSDLEQQAIDRAHAQGVIVVAAAGNYSNNWDIGPADIDLDDYPPGAPVVHKRVMYPAAGDHVIGVGALGYHEGKIAIADFSNSGPGLDVMAPGEEVFSTMTRYNPRYPDDEYAYMSGTSMATPHVSGLAALLLSQYPGSNPDEIEGIIKRTADQDIMSGDDTYGGNADFYGAGMVDAYGAVGGEVRLNNLVLESGSIEFDPRTMTYAMEVTVDVSSVGIKPVRNNGEQKITINDQLYTGSGFFSVPLNIGVNTITIKVTAKDLVTTGTYVLNVTRPLAEDATLHGLNISAGTLSPAFNPGIMTYTTQVAHAVTGLTITPIAAENVVIKINGTVCISGKPYAVILNIGSNLFNMETRALDGGVKNYSLAITRAGAVTPPPPPVSGGGGGGGGGAGGAETVVSVNRETTLNLNTFTATFHSNSYPSEFQAEMGNVTYGSRPFSKEERLIDKVYVLRRNVDGDLDKPMTLTFAIKSKDVDLSKEHLAIYYLDEKTNKWKELPGVTFDSKKMTLTGESKLFTEYAVIALPNEVVAAPPVAIPVEEIPASVKTVFSDLQGHWSEKQVDQLVAKKAIAGYPDGSFRPDALITRSEFIAVLVKAQGMTGTKETSYPDMAGHWAQEILKTGYANGVVSGYPDGLFHPNDPITREQMAVLVDRTLRYTMTSAPQPMADQGEISSWAEDAVKRMLSFKVMGGYPDGTFRPKALATRAEAAAVILKTITD